MKNVPRGGDQSAIIALVHRCIDLLVLWTTILSFHSHREIGLSIIPRSLETAQPLNSRAAVWTRGRSNRWNACASRGVSVGENCPDTAGHPSYPCGLLLRPGKPIRTVVYPRVLNKTLAGSPAASRGQNVRTYYFQLLEITHCHCVHYCVGGVIMSARSNSSARRDLSAMYPGVKSIVWPSDAIPQGCFEMACY
jgi:hypothetical protein